MRLNRKNNKFVKKNLKPNNLKWRLITLLYIGLIWKNYHTKNKRYHALSNILIWLVPKTFFLSLALAIAWYLTEDEYDYETIND